MTPNVPPRVWGQATAAHTDESFRDRIDHCWSPEHLAAALAAERYRPGGRNARPERVDALRERLSEARQ